MNPTAAQLATAAQAIPYVDDPERVARDVLSSLLPVGYAMVHLTRRNIWLEPNTGRRHQPNGGFIRCALLPVEDAKQEGRR